MHVAFYGNRCLNWVLIADLQILRSAETLGVVKGEVTQTEEKERGNPSCCAVRSRHEVPCNEVASGGVAPAMVPDSGVLKKSYCMRTLA